MIKQCIICDKEFKTSHKQNKYCSQECYYNAMHKTNEYVINDDYALIICYSKKYGEVAFKIDKEDVKKCQQYYWHIDCTSGNLYVKTNIRVATNKQKHIKLHRFLMDCPQGKVIDHINRNTLDNRKSNMRICTHTDNKTNRKDNTSGRCGVYYNSDCKKWYARLQANGIQHDLGMFENKQDAINARIKAEKQFNVEVI